MNENWLKDDMIRLRAPEPEDLELMYAMENDTSLWSVGNATLPYSRYTLREYLEQSRQDLITERQARFVIEIENGERAAMIDLADYDPINGRAEVCIGILGGTLGNATGHYVACESLAFFLLYLIILTNYIINLSKRKESKLLLRPMYHLRLTFAVVFLHPLARRLRLRLLLRMSLARSD